MQRDTRDWVCRASSHEHGHILLLIVCQALHGASGIAYALILRGLVDAAVSIDVSGFWLWVSAAVILLLMAQALRSVVRWLDELTRAGLENTLKMRLFDGLLHGDFGRVSAVHSAEWMNRLTSDAKIVADGCVDILPGLASMLVRLIGALAMIVWLDSRLIYVILSGGIALLSFTALFRKLMRRLHKSIQEADGRLRVFLQERIAGLLTVQSFAEEDKAREGAMSLVNGHLRERMRRTRFSNLCNAGYGLVMAGARLGAVVWCGCGILSGSMSFGTLTAMVQLVGQAQAPLASVTGYLPKWYAMLASAERLSEVEDLSVGVEDALSLAEALHLYENDLESVRLSDVTYTYWPSTENPAALSREGVPPMVSGLSLEVLKGEFLALTGHSGCGKTTALRLLMGAYEPDAGERYLLLCDGSHIALGGAWRRLFAYVPQGNQLIGGTIREAVSLTYHGESVDDVRIWDALRAACADDFVRELPEGLETILGERGAGLSEGQMQRIAVARALFSCSPILLLDEVTSALDAPTELRLLCNLKALEDKTVVVVTHRPAALEVCDRVLEFSEEGVIER